MMMFIAGIGTMIMMGVGYFMKDIELICWMGFLYIGIRIQMDY